MSDTSIGVLTQFHNAGLKRVCTKHLLRFSSRWEELSSFPTSSGDSRGRDFLCDLETNQCPRAVPIKKAG